MQSHYRVRREKAVVYGVKNAQLGPFVGFASRHKTGHKGVASKGGDRYRESSLIWSGLSATISGPPRYSVILPVAQVRFPL